MEILAALTAGGLAGIGLWLLLDRNLVRVVLGVAVTGNAINLAVVAAGRLGGTRPAFVEGGLAPVGAANPLPQALVLTAIVIGFGVFAYALALLRAAQRSHGSAATDVVAVSVEEPAPDGEEDDIGPAPADSPLFGRGPIGPSGSTPADPAVASGTGASDSDRVPPERPAPGDGGRGGAATPRPGGVV